VGGQGDQKIKQKGVLLQQIVDLAFGIQFHE
jgi:hypothetical protein